MERNLRKERIGVVVSNKMDKTIRTKRTSAAREIPCALWKPVLSARPRGGD